MRIFDSTMKPFEKFVRVFVFLGFSLNAAAAVLLYLGILKIPKRFDPGARTVKTTPIPLPDSVLEDATPATATGKVDIPLRVSASPRSDLPPGNP